MSRSPVSERLARIYELGNVNAPDRNLPMEGLRGFAVLLVFFVHYHALFSPWLERGSYSFAVSEFLGTVGLSGVDLFFVLSGYLIYGWTIRKYNGYAKFIRRRIERIYPTFLAVLAIYLVLMALYPAESRIPSQPFNAVLYLAANILLLPGLFPIQPIITVAWSLSYEFFFYIFIPVVVVRLRLRQWSGLQRVIFFLAVAIVYTGYCFVGPYAHIHLIMFISGMLLFEATHTYGLARRITPRIDYAVYVILALTFPLIYALSMRSELFPFLPDAKSMNENYRMIVLFGSFWIFTLACFSPVTLSSRLFSWTPLRWLGNISYSYYLIHSVTLKGISLIAFYLFPASALSAAAFWFGLPIFFFLTLVSSSLLFVLVERRFSIMMPSAKGVAATPTVESAGSGAVSLSAEASLPLGGWPTAAESKQVTNQ